MAFLADPESDFSPAHATTDANHGRIEVRHHGVTHDIDWSLSDRRSTDELRLPGLHTIAMVEAEVEGDGKIAINRRFDVSSARLTPEAFSKAVRALGSNENSLHGVLDMAFYEDRARNRKNHGPENLPILLKRALDFLQSARKDLSIRRKRKRAAWTDDVARTLPDQMR